MAGVKVWCEVRRLGIACATMWLGIVLIALVEIPLRVGIVWHEWKYSRGPVRAEIVTVREGLVLPVVWTSTDTTASIWIKVTGVKLVEGTKWRVRK